MYGLVIANSEGQDIIKVASSKERLYLLVKEHIEKYLNLFKSAKKMPYYDSLIEALQVNEIEAAMEIFSNISEKVGKPSFLTILKVEFEYDS